MPALCWADASAIPAISWLTCVIDAVDGLMNQSFDLLGRFGAAVCQAPHLRGDDRKTAPLLSGARGFDCGVQCEDVGLKRYAVDQPDDLGDLLRRVANLIHRGDQPADQLTSAAGDISCMPSH